MSDEKKTMKCEDPDCPGGHEHDPEHEEGEYSLRVIHSAIFVLGALVNGLPAQVVTPQARTSRFLAGTLTLNIAMSMGAPPPAIEEAFEQAMIREIVFPRSAAKPSVAVHVPEGAEMSNESVRQSVLDSLGALIAAADYVEALPIAEGSEIPDPVKGALLTARAARAMYADPSLIAITRDGAGQAASSHNVN